MNGRMNDKYHSFAQGSAHSAAYDPFTEKLMKKTQKTYYLAENTPAYASLQSHNLLETSYRKESFDDIFGEYDLTPNSSHRLNFEKRWKWGVYCTPGCGFFLYRYFNTEVVVPPGHVCCFIDEENNYVFAKSGIHNIQNPFLKQVSTSIPLNSQQTVIQHGNRAVLTIPHGMLGYATDMGRPILIPPGLHSWTSETLRFARMYRLGNNPVIVIGPYTLVTVEEGYVGVSSDNGKLHILDAGKTHLLTHQKWIFDRFLNIEIQHDDLEKGLAATADNVLINLYATVTWRIDDITKVASKLSETHRSDISEESTENEYGVSSSLRKEVLKKVDAALSTFIGGINYTAFFHKCFPKIIATGDDNASNTSFSETYLIPGLREKERMKSRFHESNGKDILSNGSQTNVTFDESDIVSTTGNSRRITNPFFDLEAISVAVTKANQTTSAFGVEILDVSVVSANPADHHLVASLAAGVVTSAEKYRMAYVRKVEADTDTITRRIKFGSDADLALAQIKMGTEAKIIRSEREKKEAIQHLSGAREGAELLETVLVPAGANTPKASAQAIKDSDKMASEQDIVPLQNITAKVD